MVAVHRDAPHHRSDALCDGLSVWPAELSWWRKAAGASRTRIVGGPPAAGDQYDLYVDPYTNLIAYSDYLPADPSGSDEKVRATWEDYRHAGGLTTSTLHRLPTRMISLENLSFAVE